MQKACRQHQLWIQKFWKGDGGPKTMYAGPWSFIANTTNYTVFQKKAGTLFVFAITLLVVIRFY